MRIAILFLISVILILSCKHQTKESYVSINYKARVIITQENISPTLSHAQIKLLHLRNIEKIWPEESDEIKCHYKQDLDSLFQLLTPEEKSSLTDFRNKLKADINFPYTNESDSGTLKIKTSTAYNILQSAKVLPPCK